MTHIYDSHMTDTYMTHMVWSLITIPLGLGGRSPACVNGGRLSTDRASSTKLLGGEEWGNGAEDSGAENPSKSLLCKNPFPVWDQNRFILKAFIVSPSLGDSAHQYKGFLKSWHLDLLECLCWNWTWQKTDHHILWFVCEVFANLCYWMMHRNVAINMTFRGK